MKRIIVLAMLGGALFLVVYVALMSTGGLAAALGVSVEIETDLSRWETPVRRVKIFAPGPLAEQLAARLDLSESRGWLRTTGKEQDGRSFIMFWQKGASGNLADWPWSNTTLVRDEGLFSVHYVYTEKFTRSLADAIQEAQGSWLSTVAEEAKGSLKQEFLKAIGETRRRVDVALGDLISEAPVSLLVKMPGIVRAAEGPGTPSRAGSEACFEAETAILVPLILVRVQSAESRILGPVALAAVLVLAAGGGAAYWWWRRYQRRLLLESQDEDCET